MKLSLSAEVFVVKDVVSPYQFQSVTSLHGAKLCLRPMEATDFSKLANVLISPTTWFSVTRGLSNEAAFSAYLEEMLAKQRRGESLTLVASLRGSSGENLVATSTFQYPTAGFRRVEIGFTWIADAWQRTFVNSEMKYLMLEHAFTKMKTNRVEFLVHPRNEKSNRAVLRLGAAYEGTLRKWRFLPSPADDDGNRNIFSIIDDEWPTLRAAWQKSL